MEFEIMNNITIKAIGTYPAQLMVGDSQCPSFIFGKDGSYYLSMEKREGLKFDTFSVQIIWEHSFIGEKNLHLSSLKGKNT